ncbi:MAG: serine hydrolase domain-containing protein [Acidobacteriota bacterium]
MTRSITRRAFALQTAAPLFVASRIKGAQKKNSPAGALSNEFLARLPKVMELANVPGLAISIIKDGRLSWSQGFGVKKAGGTDAVDADTLFGAASLSKPVFAYTVLKMREEKLIDIDRPLVEYLPYEDLPAVDHAKLITARHVLSHSTGLQNWRFNSNQRLNIAFKPGERFSYSGEGFFYLQRVVERITGRGFEEYMRERALKPLGMTSSTYLWMSEMESRVAWGHNNRMSPSEIFNAQRARRMLEIAGEWKKPVAEWKYEDVVRAQAIINKDQPPLPNFLLPNTAGSLITSVNDYARFMIRLMERPRRDQFDLLDASRREMLTPQTKISSALSWGLGVGLESEGNETLFWHWGDNGVFKAFMMGDPAKRSGVVVLTNAMNGHRVWQRIVASATGRDHAAFLFWMV